MCPVMRSSIGNNPRTDTLLHIDISPGSFFLGSFKDDMLCEQRLYLAYKSSGSKVIGNPKLGFRICGWIFRLRSSLLQVLRIAQLRVCGCAASCSAACYLAISEN